MDRFDAPEPIAAAILSAPGWARVGLTVRDPDMRERAAHELARSILERMQDQRA